MSEEVHVIGPVGRLEGIVEQPDGPVRGVAVICHPHPLHAGSMRNTIVFRTARALRAAGLVTLRFNFRGVEGSEGVHDGKGAEAGDVAACLDYLAERHPGLPLWGAGYSFGARTICELATHDERLERIVRVRLGARIQRHIESVDIVQETFAVAFQKIEEFEFRSHASILSWLARIAENQIRDANKYLFGL